MMRRTTRHLCQPRVASQRSIKLVTLFLRGMILPVRAVGVTQCAFQMRLETGRTFKAGQQLLGLVVPEYASVLLARTADAPDAVQRRVLLLQAGEDQVDGLEPHGDRREDLTLVFIDEYALLQAILCAKVCIEVYFCFGDDM